MIQAIENIMPYISIIVAYIWVVWLVTGQFKDASTKPQAIFWGIMFLITLSFLFSRDESNHNNSNNSWWDDRDDDNTFWDNRDDDNTIWDNNHWDD